MEEVEKKKRGPRGPYKRREGFTPLTAAEKSRRHREKLAAFEIGEIVDAARRESCRLDLTRFGVTYCRHLLHHEPSEMMVNALIRPLQNVILYGGQQVCLFPRGTGKTTWMKIAMVWAIVYAHKRFVVTIAATSQHAKNFLEQVIDVFALSPELMDDFPALATPVRAIESNWRKATSQKHNDRPTEIQNTGGYFVLPKIYDEETDELVEPACGARVYTAGIHGAIRGLANGSERPDLIFFDDPQTRKEAESRQQSDKLESLVTNDALGCFGNNAIVSAVMAVTPIKLGDIATRFSSRKLHPEWGLSKQAYIVKKSAEFDSVFPAFKAAYQEDVDISDREARQGVAVDLASKWRLSTEFYQLHKAALEGTEVVDPLNFADGEVDAVHHLLKVMCRFKDLTDFDAEYQMNVERITEGEPVTPEEVQSALNGFPRYLLPHGTTECVAYVDVNIQKKSGLRYCVCAFGPNRVAAVIDYGAFPTDGSPLVPPNATPGERQARIDAGLKAVTQKLLTNPYAIASTGERVIPVAMCVDAGFEPDQVHKTVSWIGGNVRLSGMAIMCSLGRNWKQYRRFRAGESREVMVKDHVYSGVTLKRDGMRVTFRKYLGIQTDFWRELAQKAFRRKPLIPGSVSLFGKEARAHYEFALETTYEQLVQTYRDVNTGRMAWEWVNESPGHNHYGDCLSGCFALAHWKDLYKPSQETEIKPMQGDWLFEFDKEMFTPSGGDGGAGAPGRTRSGAMAHAGAARAGGAKRKASIFRPMKFRRG